MNDQKVRVLVDWLVPRSMRVVHAFLVLAGYYSSVQQGLRRHCHAPDWPALQRWLPLECGGRVGVPRAPSVGIWAPTHPICGAASYGMCNT
jgi:hypothetical protein